MLPPELCHISGVWSFPSVSTWDFRKKHNLWTKYAFQAYHPFQVIYLFPRSSWHSPNVLMPYLCHTLINTQKLCHNTAGYRLTVQHLQKQWSCRVLWKDPWPFCCDRGVCLLSMANVSCSCSVNLSCPSSTNFISHLQNKRKQTITSYSERESHELKYQLLKNIGKKKATRQVYKCTQAALKIPAELNLELFKKSQMSEEPVWEPQPVCLFLLKTFF